MRVEEKKYGFLFVAVILAVLCLSNFSDAKCGKGKSGNRINIFQRFQNHRQLFHEHHAHNLANRRGAAMSSCGQSAPMIVIPPAQGPEKVAPPKAPSSNR